MAEQGPRDPFAERDVRRTRREMARWFNDQIGLPEDPEERQEMLRADWGRGDENSYVEDPPG
jgi:hypothetical protein